MPTAFSQSSAYAELLVVRCQLGDAAAFSELVANFSPVLNRHLVRVTGDVDRAKDLTQDCWIRAMRGIGGLKDGTKFRSWLFGIAHRVLADELRSRYRASAVLNEVGQLSTPADDDDWLDRELQHRSLEQKLALLPPTEREVLTLHYLEELPLGDIAAVMRCPVGTVKSRLFRARTQLRSHFHEETPDHV